MKTMPEYIEREAALKELNRNSITKKLTLANGASIFDTIKNIPAADVVEVVRCKDCNFFGKNRPYRDNILPFSFCDKFHHNITTDDDFCSYGERKEGAEE